MDKTINRNLTFLSRQHPSLIEKILPMNKLHPFHFISAPSPNILLEERPFHSRANPEREALNLVQDLTVKEGYIFLFMGIGLGYHIEIFKKMYKDAQKATIVAIEKSSQAFTVLVNNKDISFLEGIHLFIDENTRIIESFFRQLNPLSFKGYRIIRLRGAFSSFENYYTELENYFKDLLSGKLSDILTRFAFETLWMKNIVENVPSLIGRRSINSLKNVLDNKPALVIGAGPSLFQQLEVIKPISRHICIIAVDTALEPLLKTGIKPDFIVTLDAQYFNLFDFHHILAGKSQPGEMVLIADIVANPGILKYWHGPLFFSVTASKTGNNVNSSIEKYPLMLLLENFFDEIDPLDCGGSVSTTAIELALYLGAQPVMVTGLDLSYTNFMTHVNSSPIFTLYYNKSHRFNTIQSFMLKIIRKRKLQYVKGLRGKDVLSDFVFTNYLKWFAGKKDYSGNVFNVTENGADIPHLKHRNFKELVRNSYIKINKSEWKCKPTQIFSEDISLQFLHTLKDEIISSRKELFDSLKSASETDNFLHKYPFLKNILRVAKSLYPAAASACSHIQLFLNILERHVDRSIDKIESNRH